MACDSTCANCSASGICLSTSLEKSLSGLRTCPSDMMVACDEDELYVLSIRHGLKGFRGEGVDRFECVDGEASEAGWLYS